MRPANRPVCRGYGMSPETHAALIGGLVSGGVVLLGVSWTEGLKRKGQRRRSVELGTQDLLVRLPYVLMGISTGRPEPFDTSLTSKWWHDREECFRLLTLLRADARG